MAAPRVSLSLTVTSDDKLGRYVGDVRKAYLNLEAGELALDDVRQFSDNLVDLHAQATEWLNG